LDSSGRCPWEILEFSYFWLRSALSQADPTRGTGKEAGPAAYRHRPPLIASAALHGRANVHPLRSQRDPEAEEPEAPGAAVVVEVRLNTLTLPVEGLMVPTGVVEAALIPWPLVPATLIGPPLIRPPLVPKLATATVSTVILSTITALVALAVLWPARLTTIPMVGGRRAETDAQPESAKAQRAHNRASRHSFLETHCCAPSVL
jgi:hypothetical protein